MVTQRSRRVRPQWRTRFPESESGGEDVQSVVDDTGDLGPDLLAFFEGQPNVKPYLDDRLTELEAKIQSAIDIGLENRTLLEQLREQVKQGQQNGLGAIHSLDDGRVQLEFPLFYSLQVLGEEVLVGIDELSAYGSVNPSVTRWQSCRKSCGECSRNSKKRLRRNWVRS